LIDLLTVDAGPRTEWTDNDEFGSLIIAEQAFSSASERGNEGTMRTIAIEEHFLPTSSRPYASLPPAGDPLAQYRATMSSKLTEVGAGRLADLDAAGIDLQVISATESGVQLGTLDPATLVGLARESNDELAEVVRAHPDRFAGFAYLPLQTPEAAAAELERAVTKLGLKGALINGTTNGRFLDHPSFQPVLAEAERLDVPIYLHPAPPPPEVMAAYFSGLPAGVGTSLSTSAWGWHVETGLHSLRLIAAGVFDRFPRLQIIIGHMGENLPFSLARADHRLAPTTSHLQRKPAEYFHENFYITPSGYFTIPPLLCALEVVGADRIMFAVDYPFSSNLEARAFLDAAPLSPADREKIAHGNAERLLRLNSSA
jgi:predicted TIM-barrel fold metal-dependent hydrolase